VEDIPKIIKELNVENEVRFIGFIPQSELASFYKLSKISIYPSLYEGFGLPILEAMSCGTPILASNTSSIPEIVNRKDLLFDPKDTKSICDKIMWMLSDKDIQSSISKWGVERAKHFTWENAANETMNLYLSVGSVR
jgi:glycosyltransferase involved in cell wall biosynthesis